MDNVIVIDPSLLVYLALYFFALPPVLIAVWGLFRGQDIGFGSMTFHILLSAISAPFGLIIFPFAAAHRYTRALKQIASLNFIRRAKSFVKPA